MTAMAMMVPHQQHDVTCTATTTTQSNTHNNGSSKDMLETRRQGTRGKNHFSFDKCEY